MWRTTITAIARDMVAGIEWAKGEEMKKRGGDTPSIVLVGHSMGGGLAQYALSEELVTVTGLILCGAVPGSGMLRAVSNLVCTDPFVVPRILFHGLHPRSILLTTTQVRRIFFSSQYPDDDDKLEDFIQYLAESEAVFWALGMTSKFVDFRRVVQNIAGWGGGKLDGERILIMGGELDILMDPQMIHRLAKDYRNTARDSMGEKVDRINDVGYSEEAYTEDREDGVRVVIVKGAGHHVQNDLQWEVGAQRVVDFLQQL